MNLTLQEIDALITALQLMNIRDQNRQEEYLGVEYAEIIKKLENYRFKMTSFWWNFFLLFLVFGFFIGYVLCHLV